MDAAALLSLVAGQVQQQKAAEKAAGQAQKKAADAEKKRADNEKARAAKAAKKLEEAEACLSTLKSA